MRSTDITPAAWVGPVVAAYGRGRPLTFLFDFDGTLAPIIDHPTLARLPAETRSLLMRLAATPGVSVGVISGRALDDVRRLVDIDGTYLAGSGGLEIDLRGELRRDPLTDASRGLLDDVHTNLRPAIEPFAGAWIERKPGGLAVHFRALSPTAAAALRRRATTALNRHPAVRYRVVAATIEVSPAGAWDKGSAVDAILSHLGPHDRPLPAYFGDGENDREAMEAVVRADGITVGVGPEAPSIAHYRLTDPRELAGQLIVLTNRLAGPGPTTPVRR